MNSIKIIGLDPSLSNFGISKVTLDLDIMKFVVDELVLLETEPEKDKKVRKAVRKNSEDLERARILFNGLQEHARGSVLAVAEVPVGSQSARAMASYGVCLGVLASCPIPLIQVTPGEVKLIATGSRDATKLEMIEWGIAAYPGKHWPMKMVKGERTPIASKCEHLADATAAIEAGMKTDQFKQAVALMRGMRAAA